VSLDLYLCSQIQAISTGYQIIEQDEIHYLTFPIKAEFVNRAEDYRYSSAIDYAGEKGLLDVTVVPKFFMFTSV
jgi:hypothetical protein